MKVITDTAIIEYSEILHAIMTQDSHKNWSLAIQMKNSNLIVLKGEDAVKMWREIQRLNREKD